MKNRRHRLQAQPVATSIKKREISFEQAKVLIEEGFTMNGILKYCTIRNNPTINELVKNKQTFHLSDVIRGLDKGYSITEILSWEGDFRLTHDEWVSAKRKEVDLMRPIGIKSVYSTLSNKFHELRWIEKMNEYKAPDSIAFEIMQLFQSNTRLREFAAV